MTERIRVWSSGEPSFDLGRDGRPSRAERPGRYEVKIPEVLNAAGLPIVTTLGEALFQLAFAHRILGVPLPDFADQLAEDRRKAIEQATRAFLRQRRLIS